VSDVESAILGRTVDFVSARPTMGECDRSRITFYPMFRREPAGRHHIRVCRTLSCAMAGSYDLKRAFCKSVGIDPHVVDHPHTGAGPHIHTSPDGRFSIEFVECLASCGSGPVCMVNDDFYENVGPDRLPELLGRYV
jgi:NADH-quinone oxidoreductase subunit E